MPRRLTIDPLLRKGAVIDASIAPRRRKRPVAQHRPLLPDPLKLFGLLQRIGFFGSTSARIRRLPAAEPGFGRPWQAIVHPLVDDEVAVRISTVSSVDSQRPGQRIFNSDVLGIFLCQRPLLRQRQFARQRELVLAIQPTVAPLARIRGFPEDRRVGDGPGRHATVRLVQHLVAAPLIFTRTGNIGVLCRRRAPALAFFGMKMVNRHRTLLCFLPSPAAPGAEAVRPEGVRGYPPTYNQSPAGVANGHVCSPWGETS